MTQKAATRTPIQERGIKTKQKIINAGRKLFSEKGYYKTNSKEIAREAGVSTGSFYMYFPDKKPLFLEIFQSYYREITEKVLSGNLEKLLHSRDKKNAIGELVTLLYEAHTIDPAFHREAIAMIYTESDVQELNRIEEEKVIALLAGFLETYRKELTVKDLEAAARIIHKSAEEVIHSIKIFGSPINEKRMLNELIDMIYRYLFC